MDFVKLSEQRFTAKKFDVNKKIPRDDVEKLKTILQLSPSSVNSQPWVFLWGTSDNSKKRVRPAIADFNWNRIDTCSDFIVIAVRKGLDDKFQHTLLDQEIKDGRIANEEIAKECFESRKFFIDLRERTGQTLNWETKQAYIAMTALLYGAASLGIDSTPIEGFDEDKMDKLLNLDNYGVHSVLVVTLGYDAAEQEAVLGRKRLSHIERSGVISQMSNIIAHELKQPLGALLNYAAVLKLRLNDKMAEDPLTKTVVENMDAETRRISRIVDSVRKFAKKEQPAHIEYDLVRIVEKAIRTFHQQEEAKTAVPFRTDVATAPVLADPLSLELLILNLIRNAAAASKESGRPKLGVSLEPAGKRWKVTVWNNGLVLSDEQFTRLEHAAESTKPEGLGLGLSIVREIADMHSASLHFERLTKGGVRAELMIDRLATKDPEKKINE